MKLNYIPKVNIVNINQEKKSHTLTIRKKKKHFFFLETIGRSSCKFEIIFLANPWTEVRSIPACM